jgi:hypothetical protein
MSIKVVDESNVIEFPTPVGLGNSYDRVMFEMKRMIKESNPITARELVIEAWDQASQETEPQESHRIPLKKKDLCHE